MNRYTDGQIRTGALNRAARGFILAVLSLLGGCTGETSGTLVEGYVTADWLYLAPTQSGRLVALNVDAGDVVQAGEVVFALEDTPQRYTVEQARAERQALEAEHQDLTQGSRPEELAAIDAQIAEARASLEYAQAEQARWKKLVEQGLGSPATLDQMTQNLKVAQARLQTLLANRKVAELGARAGQQAAAQARVDAGKAAEKRAEWQQAEYAVKAPEAGRVEEVFFRPGEVVNAGTPVLAILPPERIKVRFYIPENRRAQWDVGQTVWVKQDGTEPVKAVIRFIGQDVEHTPPVIFSERTREALVFAAEAWPVAPGHVLKPGMPVEVQP